MKKSEHLQLNMEPKNNASTKKNKPKKIYTLFEVCSGMGATYMALKRIGKRLGMKIKRVGICEIDQKAVQMYNALHGAVKNYGDVTKIAWQKIVCDILSFTFPCTDISTAGQQKGFKSGSGTSSSIVWALKIALRQMIHKPSMIFMENVAAILNKKNLPVLMELLDFLRSEGYYVRFAKLDASDYNVPQHRERVYMICTYGKDVDFEFPKGKLLDVKLRDILEKDVDEKYYLATLREYFIKHSLETPFTFRVHNPSFCEKAFTLTTRSGSRISDNFIFEKDLSQDAVLRIKQSDLDKKGVSLEDVYNTRIRKLTPRETMLLMGLNEDEIERLKGFSDTSIYKLMGNAIVVPVLENIFYEYFSVLLKSENE